MSKGGALSIQSTLGDSTISIMITDTGSGIPQEILAHIQKPFFTTKKQGTRLGLMVSNKIIAAHKGKLAITSERNEGTTISITLPFVINE